MMNSTQESDVNSIQSLWIELTDVDSELVSGGYYSYYYPYGGKKNSNNQIVQFYSFNLIGDNNVGNGNYYG